MCTCGHGHTGTRICHICNRELVQGTALKFIQSVALLTQHYKKHSVPPPNPTTHSRRHLLFRSPYSYPFIHPFIHSLTHSLNSTQLNSLILYPFAHLFIHPFTHPRIHSPQLTHEPNSLFFDPCHFHSLRERLCGGGARCGVNCMPDAVLNTSRTLGLPNFVQSFLKRIPQLPSEQFLGSHTHTHTHTYIYIYIHT